MLMILAQAHPGESEDAVVERLLAIRPQAWPNSRMIGFADELLGRSGRLLAAVGRIYARRLKAFPEFGEMMRRGNRGREVEMGLGRKVTDSSRPARPRTASRPSVESVTDPDFSGVRRQILQFCSDRRTDIEHLQ